MAKRGLTFRVDEDNPMASPVYVTADIGWTLTSCELSAPVQKTSYIDKPGGDGAWDLSTTMTDGIPRYQNRTLTATLELSTLDRLTRDSLIRGMVNTLDGRRLRVLLPDDNTRYLVGRVHVAKKYSNLAHASVVVTMDCEPWKYRTYTTTNLNGLSSTEITIKVTNNGGRTVIPTLEVAGSAKLTYGTATISLTAGKYTWPELVLTPGTHELKASGSSSLVILYREAVLE